MHSTLNRAQGVFGFFTTVALFVAGLAALSVFLYPTDDVTSSVKLRDVKVYVCHLSPVESNPTQSDTYYYNNNTTTPISKKNEITNTTRTNRTKGRPHYYSTRKEEYAAMKFDLDAGTSLPPPPCSSTSPTPSPPPPLP